MIKNPWAPPNQATRAIGARLALFSEVVRRGLIQVPVLDVTKLPSVQMRLEPFQFQGSQVVAAPAANTINWVIDQDFDRGFMGVVTGLWVDYPQPPGGSFVDGAGSLWWTFAIDWRYVPNFNPITQRLGSRQTPFPVPGVPIFPGQNVKIGYSVPPASPITTGGVTQINVGLVGYKFPATKHTTM